MGAMTFRVCPQRNQASRARVRSTPDVLPPPGATLGEVLLQELEEAPSAKANWPSLDSEASTERSESSSDRSRRHKQQKAELLSPPPSGCVPKGRRARCAGVEAPEDMDAWHRATCFSEAVKCLATDANGASVTKLALVGVALTDEEASRLADHLHSNPNVLRLALVECNLGDQAAEHLAEALAANDVLTSLSLEGNRVGDRGAGRLANALQRNEALTSLSLGRNCVGNQGVKQLLDALENNYTLRILDLTSNSVSRPGWSIAGDGRTANQKRLQALLQRNRAPRKVVTLRAQLQSPRSSESEFQVGGDQLPERTDDKSLDALASAPQTLHISCTSMAGTVLTELALDASKGLRELREELAARLGLPKPQLALLLPDGRLLKARDHRSLMEIFTCLDSRSDADDPIEC